MLDEINVHENPAAPDFDAGDFPASCLGLEGDRVHMEKSCRFLQVQGLHGRSSESAPGTSAGFGRYSDRPTSRRGVPDRTT